MGLLSFNYELIGLGVMRMETLGVERHPSLAFT